MKHKNTGRNVVNKEKLNLRQKAEQIIDFTPQEISQISPDEIQRLFYDLQIYQIELQMQNDELKAAHHELTASRNNYHFLFHQAPIGIIIVNHQGFIEKVNDTFSDMLGIGKRELINKHFSTFIAESDKTQFNTRFNAFFKSPKDKSINLKVKKKDGSELYVRLLGKQNSGNDFGLDEGSEKSQLILTVTDISDLR